MTAVVACRGKCAAPQKGQGRVKENLTGVAGTGNGEVERSIYRLQSMFFVVRFLYEKHTIYRNFKIPASESALPLPGIYKGGACELSAIRAYQDS